MRYVSRRPCTHYTYTIPYSLAHATVTNTSTELRVHTCAIRCTTTYLWYRYIAINHCHLCFSYLYGMHWAEKRNVFVLSTTGCSKKPPSLMHHYFPTMSHSSSHMLFTVLCYAKVLSLLSPGVNWRTPWKNRIYWYISFSTITQSCSVSDVLFTGGRGVSDFSVLKYY